MLLVSVDNCAFILGPNLAFCDTGDTDVFDLLQQGGFGLDGSHPDYSDKSIDRKMQFIAVTPPSTVSVPGKCRRIILNILLENFEHFFIFGVVCADQQLRLSHVILNFLRTR